ncbi:MAG: 30S ribosomal protein S17 [Oligoflexia bacterium]|nr:30S ribosomal protein S17 [Oligoflexia bacterium]
MSQQRGQVKKLVGTVISNKADKTIVVKVPRRISHAKYGKFVITHSKYHAHDPKNEASIGDEVEIFSCRPISKTKKWKLNNITRKVVEL